MRQWDPSAGKQGPIKRSKWDVLYGGLPLGATLRRDFGAGPLPEPLNSDALKGALLALPVVRALIEGEDGAGRAHCRCPLPHSATASPEQPPHPSLVSRGRPGCSEQSRPCIQAAVSFHLLVC